MSDETYWLESITILGKLYINPLRTKRVNIKRYQH